VYIYAETKKLLGIYPGIESNQFQRAM